MKLLVAIWCYIYTWLYHILSIHWWFHLCDYPIQRRYFLHIFHGMLKNAHVHQYDENLFSFLIILSHIHILPYHPQVLSPGLPNGEAPRFKNMMIDANSRVTMVDFGLAVQVAPGQELHDSCGTVPFAAPEARLTDVHRNMDNLVLMLLALVMVYLHISYILICRIYHLSTK